MLAAREGGRLNQTSGFEIGAATITVNVSAPDPADGSRTGTLMWRGRNSGPTAKGRGIQFPVLAGEMLVNLRVLVDRSVIEAFVAGGRAHLVSGEYAELGHTYVHMRALGDEPVTLSNFSIWSMGCGWL